MARKTTNPKAPNEIHIKEADTDTELFRPQADPYVLPPEIGITVRDGFRFGMGLILALLLFMVVFSVGVAIFVNFIHFSI